MHDVLVLLRLYGCDFVRLGLETALGLDWIFVICYKSQILTFYNEFVCCFLMFDR